jgi:H+/gluconate symporter-like permease
MGPKKIGGIVLMIVGIGIAFTGYEMSQGVGDQLGAAMKGSPTDSVLLRYLAGAACAGVGAFLAK